jgi:hypothetical protein
MTTRDNTFHVAQPTLYEDVRTVFDVYRLNQSGSLDINTSLASFDQFILQSAQQQDSEKVQIALASDAPKLYAFGRQHRFYTYQGILIDSDLENQIELQAGPITSIWTGDTYNEWQSFYDNFAKLSVCADERYLVELKYASKIVYGAINQMTVSANAVSPHIYDVVFSMYVVSEENLDLSLLN